jgi:hypothetical protein
MKKLKLEVAQFKNAQTLTRDQLKNVFGGIASTCKDTCFEQSSCPDGEECDSVTFADGATCNKCVSVE